MALFNKGIAQGQRGDLEAEIASYDEVVERFGDSEDRELLVPVARALVNKGEVYRDIGNARDALLTSERIERQFGALVDDEAVNFAWWSKWIKANALFILERPKEAMHDLRSLFAAFVPENDAMLRTVQTEVPALIAAGAMASFILEILSIDKAKSDTIAPLVVALRQEAGETVRAPAEVLEVAADIRRHIASRRQTRRTGSRTRGAVRGHP